MGKRLWGVILFLLAAALGAEAQYYAVNGACSLGGQATVMQGMASSGTKPLRGGTTFNGSGVMASYPGCTVTVYQTGTNVPALIYSTAIGGSRSNPFTGDLNDGSWVFFAAAGCYDITISSGATQASTMPTPKSFPGVCAGAGGSGSGGGTAGTTVTVNGVAAVPNQLNFTNTLLVPSGSTVVNFLLNGNTVGAYVTGTGGGGGATLPTTPQYDLFASTGAGAAQASGLLGGSGFMKGQVFLATGDVTSAPAPFPIAPNASVEYFPSGASFGGINIGATNGLAAYFSHSGRSGAAPGYGNGGLALGGGNNSGTNYQVYLDCESAPALNCDFKVPITVNGSAVGGGGGGSLPGALREVLASNGVGGAQATGTYANNTFFRAGVLESTGAGTLTSPFSNPNGSIEYFPTGGYGIGGANGVALHFSHSAISNGTSPGWGNGGVALAGGNASGVNYQIYLDCESAPLGCDFKVPVTINGAAIGGGGGGAAWGQITGTLSNQADLQSALNGKLSTTGTAASATALAGTPTLCTSGQAAAGILANGNATGCVAVGGGAGSGTVSSGTAGHFTWYATAGTTVTSNANLDDSVSTAATITSQETLAAPGINVTGSGGIAMTGAGGTLPTPAANSGGIGIGPGNVPQFYSNGGAWTNIGSGGGAVLPTIPTTNLYASNGAGGAQDSNVQAMPATGGSGAVGTGYVKSGALLVGGTGGGTSPFLGAQGSQEWYGVGGVIGSVTVPNGAVLLMGNSASTAGPTGNGGVVLGGNSATVTSSKEVYVDCEHTGCDFKAPITVNGGAVGGGGGSGTVNPNPTIVGSLAYYPAAANSNAVGPVPFGTANSSGINVGPAILMFGANTTTTDTGMARIVSAIVGLNNGGNGAGETSFLRSGNSCAQTTAISFSNTGLSSTFCAKGISSRAQAWIIHCVIPWNLTGGSGNSTVQFGFNTNVAPTAVSFFSTLLSGATGTVTAGTASLPATSGTTWLITSGSLAATDATVYMAHLDGLFLQPALAANISITAQTGTAGVTGQINAGAYCRFE